MRVIADDHKGTTLECEVRVKDIQKLRIVTKTRRIEVGNFESVELMALDDQQNVFSSIQDIPFYWELS